MKKFGLSSGLSGLSGMCFAGDSDLHTWFIAGIATYQNSDQTAPAINDNDPIGAFISLGNDKYSVIQATDSARPTLKLNIKNGEPVLRLDGGDWLRGAFTGSELEQPFTVFVVAKLADAAVNDDSNHVLIDGDDDVNRAVIFQQADADPDSWTIYAGKDLVGGDSDGNWDIFTVLFNGLSSQAWINGVSNVSGDAEALGLDGLTIGAVYNNSNPWIGDIAEIIIYRTNLSTNKKNEVGHYLSNKYDISYTDIT